MAKVTAPFLSLSARGTLGKTLVASRWRGIPYFRQHVIPANPKTVGQVSTRDVFSLTILMWKLMGTIARSAFDLFASGRPFTGSNAFTGQNIETMRGQATMDLFIGSPGAKGGLAVGSVTAAAAAGSGEIDVTIVAPTLPTGWTIVAAQAMGFPDQDPETLFVGPIDEGEDLTTPYQVTLTGLGSAVDCQVAGWIKYLKPNGDNAYSVGVTVQATSGT